MPHKDLQRRRHDEEFAHPLVANALEHDLGRKFPHYKAACPMIECHQAVARSADMRDGHGYQRDFVVPPQVPLDTRFGAADAHREDVAGGQHHALGSARRARRV